MLPAVIAHLFTFNELVPVKVFTSTDCSMGWPLNPSSRSAASPTGSASQEHTDSGNLLPRLFCVVSSGRCFRVTGHCQARLRSWHV